MRSIIWPVRSSAAASMTTPAPLRTRRPRSSSAPRAPSRRTPGVSPPTTASPAIAPARRSRSTWRRWRYSTSHSSYGMSRAESCSSMAANSAAAASSNRGGLSGVAAGGRASAASRSSTACASALIVRCAADVVSRLAMAARARATSRGLARDQQVHRVDEDVEVLAVELDELLGDQRRGTATRHRREPLGGLRHRRRRVRRHDLDAGRLEGPVEVGRHLVVLAGLDHERDVGVGPTPWPGSAPCGRWRAPARKISRTDSRTVSG